MQCDHYPKRYFQKFHAHIQFSSNFKLNLQLPRQLIRLPIAWKYTTIDPQENQD